jgi:uncharacterized protein (DUF433 family)
MEEPEVVMEEIDWSACPDVEQVPGKVSGQPVVVGTRILAQGVIDNAEDGYTPEQIAAEIYEGLPVERARRNIAYARKQHVSLFCLAKTRLASFGQPSPHMMSEPPSRWGGTPLPTEN